jgi:hypothetical protein
MGRRLLSEPHRAHGRQPRKRASLNMRSLLNLRRRPAKPALGNGKIQVLAWRALFALGEASTRDVMKWTYCREYYAGERFKNWHNLSTRRALEGIGAVRVGRALTRGRPWIWRLADKSSDADR